MLFVGKGSKRKFASTKSLPPDQKSLEMKILRANLISHSWINCTNGQYEQLDPCSYGYKVENGICVPLWFAGDALPSEEDINETEVEEVTLIGSENIDESDNDSIDSESEPYILSDTVDSSESDEN